MLLTLGYSSAHSKRFQCEFALLHAIRPMHKCGSMNEIESNKRKKEKQQKKYFMLGKNYFHLETILFSFRHLNGKRTRRKKQTKFFLIALLIHFAFISVLLQLNVHTIFQTLTLSLCVRPWLGKKNFFFEVLTYSQVIFCCSLSLPVCSLNWDSKALGTTFFSLFLSSFGWLRSTFEWRKT